MSLPACPACHADYTWQDGENLNCPSCGHIWTEGEGDSSNGSLEVRLKVKGSSSSLKIGTKVKSIRLVEGDHNIDCKIDGFGPMKLKSEFVKKN